MYKIGLLNKISEIGLNVLKPDKYEYSETMENPDGVILRSANIHEMEFGDNLLAIARAGAGVNNIPIERCSEEGIVVFNTPGANANAVKELVIEAMLLTARKVIPAMNWVQSLKGRGEEIPKLAEKEKSKFTGPELYGKKLGVIGLGAIGIQVSNTARHLGMEVYGYDPYMSVGAAWQLSRSIKHAENLEDLLKECDFITLHIPLNNNTKNIINKDAIAMMKDDVRLLNFSRGGLVDNSAVIEAIESGKMNSYVTDFAADELLGYENILVMPHLGASTPESEENCAEMAARELKDFLENGNIQNSVNLPDIRAAKGTGSRITLFHMNKPNMLAQISGAVGKNISNLINSSKGDYAYTMLDLDNGVTDNDLVEKLQKIDGVIRVRLIG